ncbi:hypothetical protein EU527_04240 [Candidatus Thorarchaeota archaeon]|nr:MAG: hypothetical protein EU527_04240 [Candidatus Thorarchaeota archaeon]
MWPLEALVLVVSLSIWGFIGFSLKKQYRYATQFFDMLFFFPVLAVLALIAFIITVYLLLNQTSALLITCTFSVVCFILLYHLVKWVTDYSIFNYKRFLKNISTDQFSIISFQDYTESRIDFDRINVFIRHDVDISLKRTRKMVEVEKEMGIYSTYLFRLHAEKYTFEEAIPIIRQLSNEGFEIGLHYETLAVAKGNRSKAIELLVHDIERLRKITPIRVVAAHGQKNYRNRDIWIDMDKEELEVSSAYEMKYDLYLSDAGGKRLRDKDGKYLFDRVYEAKPGDIVQVLIHPDWWF